MSQMKPPIKTKCFPEDLREGTSFSHFSCHNQKSQMKPPIKMKCFPEDLREGTRFAHFSCQNQVTNEAPIKTKNFQEDLREGTRFAHFSCQNKWSPLLKRFIFHYHQPRRGWLNRDWTGVFLKRVYASGLALRARPSAMTRITFNVYNQGWHYWFMNIK